MELTNTDSKSHANTVNDARKPILIISILWGGSLAILLLEQWLRS